MGSSQRFGRASILAILSFLGCFLPAAVEARAVLGIDLGSSFMKVALVQSGSPLEIVTNLHSKRKTEQMVLFDRQQRFYGADAKALLQRKSQMTPVAMSVMLGRDESHPVVQALIDQFNPVTPVYNETRKGVSLLVDKMGDFTPEELVAMVLSHAVEISVAYAASKGKPIPPPSDIVLTVPVFTTSLERKALMDAAALANLNVLSLVDETTAAALHYGMDKQFEEPQIFMFYNMGANSLQVSIVKFSQYEQKTTSKSKPKQIPSLQVLAKAWDATLGGNAWEHVLVEHFADKFNAEWRKKTGDDTKDIRTVPRPMSKMKIAANKAKHVLSANTEYHVYLDALHNDISLQLKLTREDFEAMTAPLLERAVEPVTRALAIANLTVEELTGIELLGGGMRVPSVQTRLTEALKPITLGLHMNSDESMALGAAFAGANISTAFRVRPVGMADITPFAQQITLTNLPPSEEGGEKKGWFSQFSGTKKEEKADDAEGEGEEEWSKQATIFKANSKVGVKKTIAFTHDKDVHCALDYSETELLPEQLDRSLERYEISGVAEFSKSMADKGLGMPKVSLQFEMSSSGTSTLVKAEATVEETYTVQEEVEVEDDEAESNTTETESNTTDEEVKDEAAVEEDGKLADEDKKEGESEGKEEESKEETNEEKKEKPKKKVMVEKEKKRTHKQPLKISKYYTGRVQPHWDELREASKAKLVEMDAKDRERVMLEESKNKVESYMFTIKNKLDDMAEELSAVSTEEQREACRQLAVDTEMWLEDEGYTADLATMEDKYAELSGPFEKILLRLVEKTARPEAVEKMKKTLDTFADRMTTWEKTMPQVTEEEREKVLSRVEDARKWLAEKEEAQAAKESHEDPAFLSTELAPQLRPVESLVGRLSKKPKPKPEKKANTTKDENSTSTNSTENEGEGDASSEKAEETAESSDTKDGDDTKDASEGEEAAKEGGEEDTEKGKPDDDEL